MPGCLGCPDAMVHKPCQIWTNCSSSLGLRHRRPWPAAAKAAPPVWGGEDATRGHYTEYRQWVSNLCATRLHEVEAGHFIDGSVRDDAILLRIHDSWTDEAGEQQVRTHGAHLSHLEALHARQSLVHLRHNPAQTVGEAVGVLLQVTDELVNQGDQLGFIRVNGGLHP